RDELHADRARIVLDVPGDLRLARGAFGELDAEHVLARDAVDRHHREAEQERARADDQRGLQHAAVALRRWRRRVHFWIATSMIESANRKIAIAPTISAVRFAAARRWSRSLAACGFIGFLLSPRPRMAASGVRFTVFLSMPRIVPTSAIRDDRTHQ